MMDEQKSPSSAIKSLEATSGWKVAAASDFKKKSDTFGTAYVDSDCVYFENLNIAVMQSKEGSNMAALSSVLAASKDVVSVRPEFYMHSQDSADLRYRKWVKEGLHILAEGAPNRANFADDEIADAVQIAADASNTWGIKAIRADQSPFTGQGIKLAILDTGFDFQHPDFNGRSVTSESFVPNEVALDGQGHGTHCTGTACGPKSSNEHPRYGVAPDAEIFIAKVLNNQGSGQEGWILAGMNWAIEQNCEVISMSLGRPVQVGEKPDVMYERLGQKALQNGSLIIAAAGNSSARQFNFIAPVGAPANSASIMAVAAVDNALQVASFSCGGVNSGGGEVDISAPGVDVFSSVPMPLRYDRFPGTSMAAPHVAGVAAMLAQSDPNLRGQALWDAMRRSALDIRQPNSDVGAGLVQAPISGGKYHLG